MRKLYVFAIGGTGARVIKALTYLLASGVKLANNFDVVPILIDPHQDNDNLKQTKSLLLKYQDLQKHRTEETDFFGTKILTTEDLSANKKGADSFSSGMNNIKELTFQNFLDFSSLPKPTQQLLRLLYSEKDLQTKMDIGFVGSPHIGAVVLNQYKNSSDFKAFAESFNREDRVFIINSIFGGTGASGFPMLVKNIRQADMLANVSNKGDLQQAIIGNLTVQPYFSLAPAEDSSERSIHKADWMIKTKAAFSYYKNSITKPSDPQVNAMYYLADVPKHPYKNDAGDNGQNNPAHFIEMIGALSIIDFANTEDNYFKDEREKHRYFAREFRLKENKTKLNLKDLDEKTKTQISRPLAKMFLTTRYLQDGVSTVNGEAFMKNSPTLSESFFTSNQVAITLADFSSGFSQWLNEMAENERSFEPFNLASSELPDAINGHTAGVEGLFRKRLSLKKITTTLNDKSEGAQYGSVEQKWLNILDRATDDIINRFYETIK